MIVGFFLILCENLKILKSFPERTLGKQGWKDIHLALPFGITLMVESSLHSVKCDAIL